MSKMLLKRYKLGELLDVNRGMSLSGEHYSETGELIRLTLGNFDLSNNGFKENTSKADIYFTGPVKKEFILEKGDIITPLTEQTPGLLGCTARIPESGKYIQSQDVALIKCKEGLLDPSFCYYLIQSASVRRQLGAAAQQTKIRHTSPDKIKSVIVDIPEIAEQRKIGSLLDSITAKIELNRSINANLEAMAKQLYDYWFVQFDFPDENGRPYKSSGGKMVWNEKMKREIPEGWEIKRLADITKKDDSKQINPQLEPDKYYKHLSFPSFDACGSYFEELGSDIHSNKIAVKEDYILAAKLNPWIKRIAWGNDEGMICSTEFVVLNPANKDTKAFIYMLVNQDAFIDYCTITSTGTSHSQRRVKPDIMRQYEFLFNEDIAVKFSEATKSLFEHQQKAIRQNKELQKQRDELLPLLMNGQVSITE